MGDLIDRNRPPLVPQSVFDAAAEAMRAPFEPHLLAGHAVRQAAGRGLESPRGAEMLEVYREFPPPGWSRLLPAITVEWSESTDVSGYFGPTTSDGQVSPYSLTEESLVAADPSSLGQIVGRFLSHDFGLWLGNVLKDKESARITIGLWAEARFGTPYRARPFSSDPWRYPVIWYARMRIETTPAEGAPRG